MERRNAKCQSVRKTLFLRNETNLPFDVRSTVSVLAYSSHTTMFYGLIFYLGEQHFGHVFIFNVLTTTLMLKIEIDN